MAVTTVRGGQVTDSTITESDILLADVTTSNVTSTKHGFAPKSSGTATTFLNGAATPAYAAVKDSDLSVSDIITNNATTTAHGLMPKGTGSTTTFFRSDMTQATPTAAAADTNPNRYITIADYSLLSNYSVEYPDTYEIGSGFTTDLASDAIMDIT